MNRLDFQRLALMRAEDAKALLDSGRYEGSYYLAGYAVECALKACIAKQTREYDFPPPRKVVEAVYTHDLNRLMSASGLRSEFETAAKADTVLARYWNEVGNWSEEARYEPAITEQMARGIYAAVTDDIHGVLTWLMKYW